MNINDIIFELEKVENKYKDKAYCFGETNIYEMCRCCRYKFQELEQELQKYKSLYQNEKDHTDTLKRIIKKIGEYVEELYDNTDDTTCYDIDKNCKKDILDLLKEIK